MAAALSASPWGPSRARAGGARAWKNTAFVGGACHSRRGDLRRRSSGLSFLRSGAGRLWGPWRGVLAEAGWDPWVFPNSSEDPSPLHTRTPRFLSLAHPIPSTVASITPAHTFPSLLAGSSPSWRGVPTPQLLSPEPALAGAGTGPNNCPSLLTLRSTPGHSQADRYTTTQPPSRRSVHPEGTHRAEHRHLAHSLLAVTGMHGCTCLQGCMNPEH